MKQEVPQRMTRSPNGALGSMLAHRLASHLPLIMVVVIASLLWGARIGAKELWHDEVYTLLEARGIGYGADGPSQGFKASDLDRYNSFPNVLRACVFMDSGNGTAYVTVLHFWSALFGNGTVALRSWSMILALLSVIIVFRLGNMLFPGRRVGALAALLLACSPLLFNLAIEARSYMQALCLTLLATILLFSLLRAERPARGLVVLYGTIAGLALLSHYSSCYLIVAHPIIALHQRVSRGGIMRILPAGVIATGMLLFWLGMGGGEGLKQMSFYNQYYVDQLKEQPELVSFYTATGPRSLMEGWGVQLLWASGNGLQFIGPRLRWILLLLAIPMTLILLVKRALTTQKDERNIGSLLILTISSMLYATILAMLSGHTVSFQAKYVVFAAPYLILVIAWAIDTAYRNAGTEFQAARITAIAHGIVVAASLVMALNVQVPVGPDRYKEFNTTIESLVDRSPQLEFVAVHNSWTAAYLCALYSEGSTKDLKHYVRPDIDATSGLIMNAPEGQRFVKIRAIEPAFPRSQPHDDPTWLLDHGTLPTFPALDGDQGTIH